MLIGMMGSGKSSVGRALARRLGWKFVDTDEQVERRAGQGIGEIFSSLGEAAFRTLEREVLLELPDREAVIALGGGAILGPGAPELLSAKGALVWLDAEPEVLAARVGETAERPLLAGIAGAERVERLRSLREERRPAYESASLRILTDAKGVEEVASEVLTALGWEVAA